MTKVKQANKELLQTAGKGALTGVGIATALKLVNLLRSRNPGKRVVDVNKDLGSIGAGAIPVYVDVTPAQAKEFERITGQKVGYETEEDRYVKMATQLKLGNEYNWLAHGAVGLGSGLLGYNLIKRLMDNLQKRNINRRLDQVKQELADLYASSASPTSNTVDLPGAKKLGHLKEALESFYTLYENKDDIERAYLLAKDHDLEKTASGVVGKITSLGLTPVKSTGMSILRTLSPFMAAIALLAAGSSYAKSKATAGNRGELKEMRRRFRETEADPYIELRPRVRQQARELDPSPLGD